MPDKSFAETLNTLDVKNANYATRFGFPYHTTLSFVPLLKTFEQKGSDPKSIDAEILRMVLDRVKDIPELHQPIEDLSLLKKYRREVDLLMTTILPTAQMDELIVGVLIPFQPVTIFGSKK